MLTIVLVGADGAGKSTVTGRVAEELTVPNRRIYLGSNPEAHTNIFPTTRAVRWARSRGGKVQHRGGPPELAAPISADATTHPSLAHRAVAGPRSAARVTNQIAEESYLQLVIWWHHFRGRVVLCDRHPVADQFAHDLARRPGMSRSRRVHGAFLRRCLPAPDLVIVLDAEPALLYGRKREGTLAELASRREEYLRYARSVDHAVVIDASRSVEAVTATVMEAIQGELATSRTARPVMAR